VSDGATPPVDAYLAALPPDQRDALADLRARLRRCCRITLRSCPMRCPAFASLGLKGKMVVGYAAFAGTLAFIPIPAR
jgi:hypothetical protein